MNKPQHLSLTYAEQFKEHTVVEAYAHRPPIPDAVFETLTQLIVDRARVILDAGCGTGAVARRLAPHVDRVDSVDFSNLYKVHTFPSVPSCQVIAQSLSMCGSSDATSGGINV